MKKLVGLIILFLIAAALYAVPPKTGTKHGGYIHLPGTQAPFRSPSKQVADSSLQKIPSLSTAVIGDRNILVILVEFKDKKFDPSRRDPDFYETMLGKEGEPAGSMTMRKYYQDMSGGRLNLTFTVFGPYDLGKNMAYYGENIFLDSYYFDKLPGDLVYEAIQEAVADPKWTTLFETYKNNWDYDGNGIIDTIIIIHAGLGEEDGNSEDIYTSRWSLSKAKIEGYSNHGSFTYNAEKTFDDYTIQPEYTSKGGVPGPSIGAICHEYGHILGLVDLYDYTYETAGVGFWSIMGIGNYGTIGYKNTTTGSDPAPLLAWEKWYLGWLTPETITPTAKPQTFKFTDIEESRKAWKIDLNPSGSQYLILEGKKRNWTGTGWAGLEDGLLITHIDEDILDARWASNTINDTRTTVHGINIVEAQSKYYETTGLGSLWNYPAVRSGTVCFRNNTKSILVPSYPKAAAGIGFFVSLLLLHRKRKKLGTLLLICCLACIIACDDGGGANSSDSGDDNGGIVIPGGDTGFHYVKGQYIPNTNYYTSELVTSKTGISGIIITVDCPAGSSSGSFTVMKEE